MRKGIIVSAALHMGVIGATMITWSSGLSQSDEVLPVVPVELITIADATNIQPTVIVEEQVPEPPPPEPIAPEPEPLPELEPEPEAIVQAEPEPEPPPVPVEKPEPPREEFNLDSVIALLDSRAESAAPERPVEDARSGIGDRNAMTMTLADSLRSQMYECWSPPIGAPNPEELIVNVDVYLTPNGALARPPQLTAASRVAAAASPYMRAAAESALRAVNICAPYRNLPVDQYAQWSEIRITFDPTRLAGR